MGGLDQGLTGLYRPGGRAAGLRKGYVETDTRGEIEAGYASSEGG